MKLSICTHQSQNIVLAPSENLYIKSFFFGLNHSGPYSRLDAKECAKYLM